MASERISALTQSDIIRAAGSFSWTRQMPKWTVIVNGREFPARPLVLDAAGVPPNDPTNSHQAIAKLNALGFETRYRDDHMQKPKYEITPSGDYLHVVCAKCREACVLDFKGRDPIMVLIEVTCPKCGSSGKWKLWQAGEGFPQEEWKQPTSSEIA